MRVIVEVTIAGESSLASVFAAIFMTYSVPATPERVVKPFVKVRNGAEYEPAAESDPPTGSM